MLLGYSVHCIFAFTFVNSTILSRTEVLFSVDLENTLTEICHIRKRKFKDCEMTLPFERSRLSIATDVFVRFRPVRTRKYPILWDT